ncbi:MarR family winged helix-turn-helix transcriptional regulator [Qipengyuania marisflavi]|uniref:MarR family transcriptional regulator n=1 Tax=Qipengyuania marisflavi TaxID=2486356 RepID=A0A5S3P2Q5_9SPHN|nr:MarR family transcriptional regulator [Qipengyuania marisflavi]TMM47264.1 MarR family transcriptional regulator [Qipengyuania marisflavi]
MTGARTYDEGNVRLWLRLLGTTRVIEKRLQRGMADKHSTTLPRFDVLAALDRAGEPLAMGALSRALLVSNGNVTGIVRTLERDGHVTLEPRASDRRVSMVSLTAQGAAHFADLAAAHHGWVDTMLSGLAPETRASLTADLGELKAVLSERPSA